MMDGLVISHEAKMLATCKQCGRTTRFTLAGKVSGVTHAVIILNLHDWKKVGSHLVCDRCQVGRAAVKS